MTSYLKYLTICFILALNISSCNQEQTLQTYYVDHELKPGFSTFDAPASLVNVANFQLSQEQKEAYESINKLNVLIFKTDGTNQDTYTTEVQQLKAIFKNKKYDELVRGGNNADGKFVIKFVGDIDNIDELILFGNAKDKGFVIVRVLGNGMNANKLMSLRGVLEHAYIEDSKLKEISQFFSS